MEETVVLVVQEEVQQGLSEVTVVTLPPEVTEDLLQAEE
jgi:hypothetical protein